MAKTIATAFKQIRRTPIQAILATMILSLAFFAVSIFTLISAGSHLVLKYFESTPQVIAFFEKGKDLTQEDIDSIKTKLEATGKLDKFEYVSTKQAEQIYKEKNKDDPMLNELVDYKILPPSIEISAKEITALKQLKEILSAEPLVKDIAFFEDVVSQLSTWINNIRYLGMGIIAFLVMLSLLILMIIIGLKIKNKRKEIEIMRLLGASKWYINGPFVIEGMIYGAVGALFGWLAAFTVLQYSTPMLLSWLSDIIKLPVDPSFLLIMLGSMVTGGMFVGAIGSLMAAGRFSKI
jgi:cell division transport system permease protein